MEALVTKRQKDFAPLLKNEGGGSRGRDNGRFRGSGDRPAQAGSNPHRAREGRWERSPRPRAESFPRFENRSENRSQDGAYSSPETRSLRSGEQRTALRAAIVAAQPPRASNSVPPRAAGPSPADILRERLAHKAALESKSAKTEARPDATPLSTSTAEQKKHDHSHSGDVHERNGKGEVSSEVLQRILSGDDEER